MAAVVPDGVSMVDGGGAVDVVFADGASITGGGCVAAVVPMLDGGSL